MNEEEIYKEMNNLASKWKGKAEPPFMSKEFIERGFDRMKYRRLREKLNILKAAGKLEEDIDKKIDLVKEVFEIK